MSKSLSFLKKFIYLSIFSIFSILFKVAFSISSRQLILLKILRLGLLIVNNWILFSIFSICSLKLINCFTIFSLSYGLIFEFVKPFHGCLDIDPYLFKRSFDISSLFLRLSIISRNSSSVIFSNDLPNLSNWLLNISIKI